MEKVHGESDKPFGQLDRYARVARNSLILLVMEPPEGNAPDVVKARDAIVHDAFEYLEEVQEGVESPYFTTHTRQDRRYIDFVAAEKVRQSEWDRIGIFELTEPKLKITDSAEVQAASFAYLAAVCMRQAPFYQAPSLRASVRSPQNLAEFVDTVATVKNVIQKACDVEFHQIVQRNEWRVAFAFWDANRWLAQAIPHGQALN